MYLVHLPNALWFTSKISIAHNQPTNLQKMMKKIQTAALFAAFALPASAATVFSFQEGDLRKDGVLFGAGASYSGTVDGSINDSNPGGTISTITANLLGNQFGSTNANRGSNGTQWNSLFSYDLTELAGYLSTNSGTSVSDASISLTRGTQTGTGGATLNLYQTQPFTTSASWSTYDGTNAWPTPNPVNTDGLAGGGTKLTQLNSNGVFSTTGLSWVNTANSNFTDAVNNALARGDKTLYMAAITDFGFNGDARITFSDKGDATVDNRPELLITVVPEPSTALLTALGALALLRRRR